MANYAVILGKYERLKERYKHALCEERIELLNGAMELLEEMAAAHDYFITPSASEVYLKRQIDELATRESELLTQVTGLQKELDDSKS